MGSRRDTHNTRELAVNVIPHRGVNDARAVSFGGLLASLAQGATGVRTVHTDTILGPLFRSGLGEPADGELCASIWTQVLCGHG